MGGSDIESKDPVSRKKPKLHQDEDQDRSDDSMSEYESDNDCYEEFDRSTHIPILFQWIERNCISDTKPDSELGQIMSKIQDLKSKGFKGISFTARHITKAYELLNIYSDPEGFKVSYEDMESCTDPEECLFYISLLKKLVDTGIVRAEKYFFDYDMLCCELMEHCKLTDRENASCLNLLVDYYEIYIYDELIELSRGLREFLLESESKEKYRKNPKSFEEMLRKDYRFFSDYRLNPVFEAFTKWWMSDSEKDGEKSARTMIDNLCEETMEKRRDRLKDELWTKADYVKLKLDVAGIVGILEVPDEIANFVLPGHHIWSSSKRAFEPVSYELE